MRVVHFLAALAGLTFGTAPLAAADLAKLDRAILKQPAYESEPKYCLLVFGAKAETRVWLAQDGNALYVDRNGNGDLTEPGERALAKNSAERWIEFEAGDIEAGGRTHKNIRLSIVNRDTPAASDAEAKRQSAENPKGPRYSLMLDVEMPGRTGRGIGGRVEQGAMEDEHGTLQFADDAQHAPIVHFDGPWQASLLEPKRLKVGRSMALYLAVGTPGVGPGSTAYLAYEEVIPDGFRPRVDIDYPPAEPGKPAVVGHYELKSRCCTICFHDLIEVPETAGVGMAAVKLSFEGVPGLPISPSQRQIEIIRPAPGFKPESVSRRLKTTLVHPDRSEFISALRYTRDGKRIIAGNLPIGGRNGMIQVWDAASGQELKTVATGQEEPAASDVFVMTPDGRMALFPLRGKRDYERIEKDGKPLIRFTFGGSVQAWDLDSGELTQSYRHTPARNIYRLEVAPNGKTFVTLAMLPGAVIPQPRLSATVWNIASGEPRELSGGVGYFGTYAPDSESFAAVALDDKSHAIAIKLLDLGTAKERLSIPIAEQNATAGQLIFAPDGKTLVGQIRGLQESGEHWLKFWDPATGRERVSVEGEKGNLFIDMAISPDSRTLAVTSQGRGKPAKLFLYDLAKGELLNAVLLDEKAAVFPPVFSPDSRWVAATTQHTPANGRLELQVDEFSQPHIHLIRVPEGEIAETIVAPPGIATLLSFAPDGKTLASNGDGQVLLWDLTNPPLVSERKTNIP